MPSLAAGHAMASARHGRHDAHLRSRRGQPSVVGEGKVIAVVPGSRQIVVDHTEIPGFMGAMTMGYGQTPVAP